MPLLKVRTVYQQAHYPIIIQDIDHKRMLYCQHIVNLKNMAVDRDVQTPTVSKSPDLSPRLQSATYSHQNNSLAMSNF